MIVKPAFKERNVPVVFSVDENYAPYLSVCICSLISNSSNTNNYDIWILDGGLTEVGKSQLKALANNRKNISIRFFDILNFKELKKKNFYISNHASLANYYRIFIPKIFFYYEKLIYLDCDLLINADIADLYAIDIGNNVLGVVKDACTYFDPDFWYKYCLEKVQIKKPYNYFNSGVLICNVKQMIDISLTERSMQRLKEFNPVCWDQCILNSVLENKVKYLPLNWNFQWHWLLPEFAQKHPFKFVEYNFLQDYLSASKAPNILHYTSQVKPWKRWSIQPAQEWWKYAKKLPIYNDILEKTGLGQILSKKNIHAERTKKMTEVKMSIIIPVYNVSPYLSRCLESVINQTLKEIEIICIDDESTDDSREILEKYAQQDSRIIFRTQKNQGQGSARNHGLSIAKGKYIQFLDSDDFYEPDCCKKMYEVMEKQKVDVACFEPNVIYEAYSFRKKEDAVYFSLKQRGLQTITTNTVKTIDVNCWNKTFRRKFLEDNNIRFPEKLHFEDVAFFWFWVTKAKVIYSLKEHLINYVRHQNSFVGNIFDRKSSHVMDAMKINVIIYDYLKKNDVFNKFGEEFVKYIMFKLQWQLSFVPNSDIETRQTLVNKTSDLLNKCDIDLDLTEKEQLLFGAITKKQYYALNCGFTSDCRELKPFFETQNVPVVFAVDKNYVPYLSVAIQSIIDNSDKFSNYDIVVLYTDLFEFQKRMLLTQAEGRKNISIRFVNMDRWIDEYKLRSLMQINHITVSAYFRLLTPEIFENYKKIIYLDCDVVANDDIAKLYNLDINNKSVAACLDTVISNNLDTCLIKQGLVPYLQNVLGMKDEKRYFNSGVLVINIEKLRETHIINYLFQLAKINNRFFHDQNILNAAFEDDYYELPPCWNLQYHVKFKWPDYKMRLSDPLMFLYDNISAKPSIIHYTSSEKPWNELMHTYTSDWWKYAKNSPFYEVILKTILTKNPTANLVLPKINKDIFKRYRILLKYYKYKILSKILFGRARRKYAEKRKIFKSRVREIRKYLKSG